MLNIFHSGLLAPVVIIFFLALIGTFGYQAYKEIKKGLPWYKSGYTKLAAGALVVFVIVLFMIARDYKGV